MSNQIIDKALAYLGDKETEQKYFTASWTATASSANNTRLTGSITLPIGLYVISICFPALSVSSFSARIYGIANRYIQGGSYTEMTVFAQVTSPITIYGESQTSTSTTFSNTERGGLRAIKIA